MKCPKCKLDIDIFFSSSASCLTYTAETRCGACGFQYEEKGVAHNKKDAKANLLEKLGALP